MTEKNNNKELNPPTEYDSLWKDIIQIYFPEFTKFFFPAAYDEIDWDKGIEILAR